MVDQKAPPATEWQQQNGSPAAEDAPANSPPTEDAPANGAAAPASQYSAPAQWNWDEPSEGSRPSRMKILGGLGGAIVVVAGIGGLIFARRHRRASRRAQALQAARESAIFAASSAGSLGIVTRVRRLLARLIAGGEAMSSTVEHKTKRAGKMAKQARKKLPR